MSFSGFIVGAFILVLASITGLKLIPAYMQNAQINNLFVTIVNDPEMQKVSPRDIRMSFSRYASVGNITAISVEDIEIASNWWEISIERELCRQSAVGGQRQPVPGI